MRRQLCFAAASFAKRLFRACFFADADFLPFSLHYANIVIIIISFHASPLPDFRRHYCFDLSTLLAVIFSRLIFRMAADDAMMAIS